MFLKAVAAFLALPVTVAFLIPQLINLNSNWQFSEQISLGVIFLLLGSFILISCVTIFYTSGKGTLAPWSPPKHLVQTGLYQYSRNPMYGGVITIIMGWAFFFGSWSLLIYGIVMSILFHYRVTMYEEPWLLENFGETWSRYKSTVKRWI